MLVICPNSLKRNWAAELTRFAPGLDFVIAEGPPKLRRATLAEAREPVVITSYETARGEVPAILAMVKRCRFALVLDESHSAKTWRSLTSTAARQIAPHCQFRWLLSGTPVTNSPSDLYTQIEILAPGEHRLGSMETFVGLADHDPARAGALAEPLVLRRTKEQCLDLPEKIYSDIAVELPPWQRKLYDDMRTGMVCALRSMSGAEYQAFASTALVQLTRLMQLASNPALLMPDTSETPGKVLALDGILDDILPMPGRKVIIWSNYVGSIETMLARYAEMGTVALYGGTPAEERQTVATRFQNDPSVRILIGNPAAAGTGFTLTAAAFSVYETLSWRYDFYAQSQDRNHRIGQELPVTYLRLIAADTIEEAIVTALERKSAMAADLLGDIRAGTSLARLSREQMKDLIENNRLPGNI
jgi:SNF2 family DNA or RNA helicase